MSKSKTDKLTDNPIALRMPKALQDRIDALVPKIKADSNVATMLGGGSRSAVIRYALLEGVKALEKRYK